MSIWSDLQQHLPPIALDALRYANGLLLLALILVPLERLAPLHARRGARPALTRDIGYYFLSSLLPARLLAWPLAGLAMAIALALPADWGAQDWPLWLRLPLALLLSELGLYWGHRAMHHWSWLWRFHQVHHSAEQLDWLSNTHAHPLDLVFTRLCGYLPLYLLGLARATPGQLDTLPLLLGLIGSAWGYLIHANLRWRWKPLQRWIATPAFHHWHHQRDGTASFNFAALLPLMDRLFGSYRVPDGWPQRYGIDEAMAPDLAGQLLQPLVGAERLRRPPDSP